MVKISNTEYFSNDRTIRFLNMDCNEFMKGLKDNEFDLNLSDPPYGIGAAQGVGLNSRRKFQSKNKQWDEYTPDKNHFDLSFKKSKNQIYFGFNYFIEFLYSTKSFIVWIKNNPAPNFAQAELIWTSYPINGKVYDNEKQIQHCIMWDGGSIHPTQKTVNIYRWIIQNYTNPSDTILDCFGGSMSNAIACHMERRKLTIIELDKDYFTSALKRFDFYERQLTLF